MRRRSRNVGAALCLLALPALACAQAKDTKTPQDVISNYSADLSIPDSPAATALGITATSIVVPHDIRDFAVSLQNVSSARTGQGAALDVAPFLLLAGRSYAIKDYEESLWLRASIRTTIGLAGSKQTIAGNDYSGTGISLSTVFFNAGDPVLDQELRSCVNKAQAGSVALKGDVKFEEPDTKLGSSGTTTIQIRDEDVLADPAFAAAVKSCFSRANSRNWNRSKVAAGVWTTRFDPLASGPPKATGGNTGWATLQYGFDGFKAGEDSGVPAASRSASFWDRLKASASFVLHYRYTHGASDPTQTPSGSFPEMNSQLAAARFTYGSASRAVYGEISRSRISEQGETSGKNAGALGASFRVAKDLWFNVAIGRRQQFSENGATSVSASFKYGTSSEPIVPSR